MKKKLVSILIIILIMVCLYLFSLKDEVINFLVSLDVESKDFKKIYLLITFFYFVSPLPITFIILLNGFLFKEYGFFISMFQIIFGSIVLNLFSNKIKNFFNINLKLIKFDFEKFSLNNNSIFISRFFVPYFFHNIYYGLTPIKIKIFILIIFLAEIPMTFALSQIGKSLSQITTNFYVSIYSLLKDVNFYIPFFIILVFFLITNYLYKKYKK